MKKLLWLLPLLLILLFLSRDKPYSGPINTFTLTEETFAAEVLEAKDLPVAVDFWAPWCGPCRRVGPVLEELAGEYKGRLRIGKLNVDDHPAVADTYDITGIPTILLFKDGKVLDRRSGSASAASFRTWFDTHL